MGRIITYEEKAQIAADDYLVVDSPTDGTQKIKASLLVDNFKSFVTLHANGISFSGNTSQSDPLVVNIPAYYYRSFASSGDAFVYKSGGTYTLENNQILVFDVNTHNLSVESAATVLSITSVVLLWKQIVTIKGEWAFYYYESFAVDYESDPLIITTPYVYYRRYATSGTGYVTITGGTYSLTHNQALVFDIESKTVEVLSVATVFPRSKKMLLWKQETTIKGPWAVYYYANKPKTYLKRVMSRQGEGYGYPDNSMEAVKSALSDGYPAIRISVALTSDNVWYCTHCYEIENNATSNCLSVDGETYTSNVFINNSTSQFMDTLSYKGYAIPKLTDVLAFVSLYDTEVTLELKDDVTTQGAQVLLNLLDYYRLKKVVLSGSTTQLRFFTAIDANLNIGVIFHYSSTNAQSVIATFSGNCKSLRFDCWYADAIAQSDVTDVIHSDYTIKLGGGAIGRADLLAYVTWADVCEYAGVYSAL